MEKVQETGALKMEQSPSKISSLFTKNILKESYYTLLLTVATQVSG